MVQHQLRHSTVTYRAFASVIGVVTLLLLLAKLSIGCLVHPWLTTSQEATEQGAKRQTRAAIRPAGHG